MHQLTKPVKILENSREGAVALVTAVPIDFIDMKHDLDRMNGTDFPPDYSAFNKLNRDLVIASRQAVNDAYRLIVKHGYDFKRGLLKSSVWDPRGHEYMDATYEGSRGGNVFYSLDIHFPQFTGRKISEVGIELILDEQKLLSRIKDFFIKSHEVATV